MWPHRHPSTRDARERPSPAQAELRGRLRRRARGGRGRRHRRTRGSLRSHRENAARRLVGTLREAAVGDARLRRARRPRPRRPSRPPPHLFRVYAQALPHVRQRVQRPRHRVHVVLPPPRRSRLVGSRAGAPPRRRERLRRLQRRRRGDGRGRRRPRAHRRPLQGVVERFVSERISDPRRRSPSVVASSTRPEPRPDPPRVPRAATPRSFRIFASSA